MRNIQLNTQNLGMSVNGTSLTFSPYVGLNPGHYMSTVDIPSYLDDTSLKLKFWDLSKSILEFTTILIGSFNNQPLTVNVWDKGNIRCPRDGMMVNWGKY